MVPNQFAISQYSRIGRALYCKHMPNTLSRCKHLSLNG